MQDSPSLESLIRGVAYAVGGALSLVGSVKVVELVRLYLERKKPAADIHRTGAQAELDLATAEKTRVEAKRGEFDMAFAYVEKLEARLLAKDERIEALETEVQLLEKQLRREAAVREARGFDLDGNPRAGSG